MNIEQGISNLEVEKFFIHYSVFDILYSNEEI